MITRAAIDPGSRWIAVTITRDGGSDSPCNYVDARCFPVAKYDHLVTYDPPVTRYRKPKVTVAPDGVTIITLPPESYTVTEEREQSPEERRASEDARLLAGDEVGAYLVAHNVEACDVETVDHVFGKTPQATSAATKAIRIGEKIVERALTIWELSRKPRGLLSPRVPILATSWRARVTPLIKAGMRARGEDIAGVLIRGKGAALEPVLVAHVPGWPGSASFPEAHREHIRDSTGLALACGMPAPPAHAKGAARPRGPRVRGASKARPRGDRARAAMGPIDLAKYRATDRARDQRHRDEARPAMLAARAAAGCLCRAPGARMTGRHRRDCPMHKGVCPV